MPIPSPADFRNKTKKHFEVREMMAQLAENVESKDGSTTKANNAKSEALEVDMLFRKTLEQLVLPIAAELNKFTQELVRLKSRVSDVEVLTASNNSKLDAYKYGMLKADFYISGTGSNTNAGTKDAPYRDFSPLLAMAVNSLDNKIISVERGTTLPAFDTQVITAKNLLITTHGSLEKERPFIDCTALIPSEDWTLHSTGVYKCTLTHNTHSKTYPNFFNNGVPVQKVTSISALANASDFAVYADNQTNATFTAYIKASSAPTGIRWSKYGIAINVLGEGSIIDNFYALGNADQDGAFKISTPSNEGGCTLSRCRVDWGSRHSAYVGSGAKTSVVEYCEFYGGADDVETGNVLNTGGGANAVVFNTTDHQNAVCISRFNVYDGLNRPNYNSPSSPTYFTGPYGHDGAEGRPMTEFYSIGDTFRNIEGVHSMCAQKGEITGAIFENVTQLFSVDDQNCAYTMKNCKGNLEQLVRGTAYNTTINWLDNEIVCKDMARGTPGFVRTGETNGVVDLKINGGVLDVQGIRTSSAPDNRTIFRMKNGSLQINNLKVLPEIATPFTYAIDIVSGGAFTLSNASDNNTWSLGTVFRVGSTKYNLSRFKNAGYEGANSKPHTIYATHKDDFDRADSVLANNGYKLIAGDTATFSVKSNKLTTMNGTTSIVSFGSLPSINMWAKKSVSAISSNAGIGLSLLDASNFMIGRETSTRYEIQVINGGASTVYGSTDVTPAVGHEVYYVIKDYVDPLTKVTSKRAWIVADNQNILTLSPIVIPSVLQNVKSIGFANRGSAQNPILGNAEWGVI